MTTARPEPRRLPAAATGPLVIVGALVLQLDRLLGVTAWTLVPIGPPGAGASARIGPAVLVTLLVDLGVALLVVGALAVAGTWRRLRGRRASAVLLVLASLVALQLGAVALRAIGTTEPPADLYLARALLLAATVTAARAVVVALLEHRAAVTALRAAGALAETLAGDVRDAIVALRSEVARQVRDVLDEALAVLGAGRPDSGARLRTLADEVLRPLAHRLAAGAGAAIPARAPVAPLGWGATVVEVARTPVIPVRTLALLTAGLAMLRTTVTDQDQVRDLAEAAGDPEVVGLVLDVDGVALLQTLGELGLVLVAAWWGAARVAGVVDRLLVRRSPTLAWSVTVAGLVGVAALTLVGPLLFAPLVGRTGGDAGRLLLATLLPLVAVTVGVTVASAVESRRVSLQVALARRSADAERTAARLQAVLAHEQRRSARTLHSDVQSAVNAAGLLVDRAVHEGSADGGDGGDGGGGGGGDAALSPALVEEVAARLAGAIERFLAGDGTGRPLRERLGDVRDLWAGVCDVTVDMAEGVAVRIDGDPVARDLLVELAAEACANAVVHGGARVVRLGVVLEGADQVTLTASDDGRRRTRDAEVREGLGSRVLRASCTRSSLELGQDGARLTATVPLG